MLCGPDLTPLLGGDSGISKSEVSRICGELDQPLIVTDTLGLLLLVLVTAADVHDVHPGRHLGDHVADRHPSVSKMWGDTPYRGAVGHAATRNIDLEITTKGLGVSGFRPLWQRWKAERTLAWLGRSRRLARDYET